MKLGIHLAIEHSIKELPILAKNYKLDCFQFFSKNPRRWSSKPIDIETAQSFKNNLKSLNINNSDVFIHCSYLINLANPSEKTYIELENEFQNGYLLGVYNLVLHPGSCKTPDCLNTVIKTIHKVLKNYPKILLLLENTTRIGCKLEDLKYIKETLDNKVNYCIDTCHLFVSGYNLSMENIDNILGLKNIKLWHLNDSKSKFNSKLDYHANIGKGLIGIENIKKFLLSVKTREVKIVLETPGNNATRAKEVDLIREII